MVKNAKHKYTTINVHCSAHTVFERNHRMAVLKSNASTVETPAFHVARLKRIRICNKLMAFIVSSHIFLHQVENLVFIHGIIESGDD